MVFNKNNDVVKTIQDVAYLYPTIDEIPKQISNDLQLVLDVNPNHNREQIIITLSSDLPNPQTYSVRSDADFYITSFMISTDQLVGDRTTYGFQYIEPSGNTIIVQINMGNNSCVVSGKGTRVKRGTDIQVAAGDNFHQVTMFGYYQDTNIYDATDPQEVNS